MKLLFWDWGGDGGQLSHVVCGVVMLDLFCLPTSVGSKLPHNNIVFGEAGRPILVYFGYVFV